MEAAMTEAKTYNGWSNYATWGVNLILSNDEGLYSRVNERVEELKEDAPHHHNVLSEIWNEEEAVRFDLADFLKDFTQELCGLDSALGIPEPSMMAQQMISAGMADVDWQEIADAWLTD